MDASDAVRRIGAGGPLHGAVEPSSAWFPQLVTPANVLSYWNDLDDHTWPILARHWLSRGFESDGLRSLAELTDAREVSVDDLVAVVRSVGGTIESPVEFLARCVDAIARIQPDLDATGFGQYRMRAANASIGRAGLPAVCAALPDGSWWSSGAAMTQHMDDAALVLSAAESVSDTLVEVLCVFWPTCARHAGPPMTLNGNGPVPMWHCERGDHDVAPLGQLTVADVEQ
jgi:hypothetical protein